MSAYPMAKMPTIGEFLNRLQTEYGVKIRKIPYPISPADKVKLQFLSRKVDGKMVGVVLPTKLNSDDDMLMWTNVRIVCDRLEIPREDFGLTLG